MEKISDFRIAYSNLEPDIRDLHRQARIALQLAIDSENDDLVLLAIEHFHAMSKALEEKWDRLFDETMSHYPKRRAA